MPNHQLTPETKQERSIAMTNRSRIIVTSVLATFLLFSFTLGASAATTSYNRLPINYNWYWGGKLPTAPQQPAPQQPAPEQPAPEQPATEQPQPQQPSATNTGSAVLSADEQKMLDLVNAERAKAGVAPLAVNPKLTEVARIKAKDMIDNNYFSHTSPTYGSPGDMIKKFGIAYNTVGENLAGASSVDAAHTNLMNSSGHRANILNQSFKEVGIGIVDGGPYGKMFVQMFIG